jgi:peptidoglycan/LPS O-acetylase OafA/YrhL
MFRRKVRNNRREKAMHPMYRAPSELLRDQSFGWSRERITSLDTLRGIAALAIILWHFPFYFGKKPFPDVFMPFYNNGQVCVDLFFVLSGFVLAYVYGSQLENFGAVREFVIRRLARLYPLHLVTLLATACLIALSDRAAYPMFIYPENDLKHFLLNIGLLQYIGLEDGFSYNAPSWSISTEFWVNVLFACLAFLVGLRQYALAAALCFVAAAVQLGVNRTWTGHSGGSVGIDPSVLRTIAGFYAGVIAFRIWSRWSGSERSALLCMAVGAAILAAAMTTDRGSRSIIIVEAMAALLGAPLLVYGCAASRLLRNACHARALRWIGNISYSTYLWHYPVAMAVCFIGVPLWVDAPLLLCLYVYAVCAVSTLSFRILEMPSRAIVLRMALLSTRP